MIPIPYWGGLSHVNAEALGWPTRDKSSQGRSNQRICGQPKGSAAIDIVGFCRLNLVLIVEVIKSLRAIH